MGNRRVYNQIYEIRDTNFFLLFAHFYIKAYLIPKTKLKVRMC
jgi:hypothetical protein